MNNLLFIPLLSVCLILSQTVQADTDSEFIRAALDDTPDRVKALFEKGADISATDEEGETALMKASNNGILATVEFLIEKGADVNAKDKKGETPLMYASAFDECSVMKLLIDKGANVNAKDYHGWSALIYAAFNGRQKAVRLLLRNNADAEYAMKYANESLSNFNIYVGADTSGSGYGGYQKIIDTINTNQSLWQRIKGYFDCIL